MSNRGRMEMPTVLKTSGRRMNRHHFVIAILCIGISLSFLIHSEGVLEQFTQGLSLSAPTNHRTIDAVNDTSPIEGTRMPANTRQGICSVLPPGITASSLWKQNLVAIADESRSKLFKVPAGDNYPDWLEPLLDFLSTSYLRKGYRHAPLPSTYSKILDIVYKRMQNATLHPPLQVVVFGGSVTQGSGSCLDAYLPPHLTKSLPVPQKGVRCNWVNTVQRLFDAFLGPRVVHIHNLAIGGTNSLTAIPIIKYNLYHTESPFLPHGPDVIVSAYSTNDAFVSAQMTNVTQDAEWKDEHRERVQTLIRAAIQSRPCSPGLPMIMYMDDYLGNQHEILMGEHVHTHVIAEMTEWYHVFLVSYADAIRRLVYANTQENAFSGRWIYGSKPQVDVHFPMSGHMTAAWVVCFAILQSVVDFCEDETPKVPPPFPNSYSETVMELLDHVVPPPLTKGVVLEHVSNQWLEAGSEQKRMFEQCKNDTAVIPPCPFAFVAGPAGTVRSAFHIDAYLDGTRVKDNDGWIGIDDSTNGWSVKIGYAPTKPGATTTFFVDNLNTDIHSLEISYLKSYGEKWMGSKVKFTIRKIHLQTNVMNVSTFELDGYHDSPFSVSFSHNVVLSIPKGDRVEVEMTLVGGTTFKLISLMMCHQY